MEGFVCKIGASVKIMFDDHNELNFKQIIDKTAFRF